MELSSGFWAWFTIACAIGAGVCSVGGVWGKLKMDRARERENASKSNLSTPALPGKDGPTTYGDKSPIIHAENSPVNISYYESTAVSLPPNEKRWLPQAMPEGTEYAIISTGGGPPAKYPTTLTEFKIAQFGDSRITGKIKANRLYVIADITDGQTSFRIEDLSLKGSLPPSWDRNCSDNAIEIVGADNLPIFQLYYKTPEQVVVKGLFPSGDGMIAVFENGLFTGSTAEVLAQVKSTRKPIFKYPSFKYQGKYAD